MEIGMNKDEPRKGKRINYAPKASGFTLAWDVSLNDNVNAFENKRRSSGLKKPSEQVVQKAVTQDEVLSYFQKYQSTENMPIYELDRVLLFYRQQEDLKAQRSTPTAAKPIERARPIRPVDTAGSIINQEGLKLNSVEGKRSRREAGSQIVFGNFNYFKEQEEEKRRGREEDHLYKMYDYQMRKQRKN